MPYPQIKSCGLKNIQIPLNRAFVTHVFLPFMPVHTLRQYILHASFHGFVSVYYDFLDGFVFCFNSKMYFFTYFQQVKEIGRRQVNRVVAVILFDFNFNS